MRWTSRLLLLSFVTGAGCSRGNMDAIEVLSAVDSAAVDVGALDAGTVPIDAAPQPTLEDLQRDYIELRFGMLLHFGVVTYTGNWSQPNLPIDQFNPTKLDAGQWADAAVAAKMKYGILSVKHIDGFALWNSQISDFDVGAIPWRNGKGDVVREFVEAFRARGLKVGFLYAMWDSTAGIDTGSVSQPQLNYIKTQLTELLTNYGEISYLLFTGWAWRMGHVAIPYQEIRQLVKSLQPNCLLFDQTQLANLWDTDGTVYDEVLGGTVPADNTLPATQMNKINSSGGVDWFWAPDIGGLATPAGVVQDHLQKLEARWTNYLLNCPPNRDGLLDQSMVDTLTRVGAAWAPNLSRAPLSSQGPQNEFPYTIIGATATSGTAADAVDGATNFHGYTAWGSSGPLPQSVTADLGVVYPDVGLLNYVPGYQPNETPDFGGSITSYAISTSADNVTFALATTGTWLSSGTMKTAVFGPVPARYVRLEARAATGGNAAATEIAVGARR